MSTGSLRRDVWRVNAYGLGLVVVLSAMLALVVWML